MTSLTYAFDYIEGLQCLNAQVHRGLESFRNVGLPAHVKQRQHLAWPFDGTHAPTKTLLEAEAWVVVSRGSGGGGGGEPRGNLNIGILMFDLVCLPFSFFPLAFFSSVQPWSPSLHREFPPHAAVSKGAADLAAARGKGIPWQFPDIWPHSEPCNVYCSGPGD